MLLLAATPRALAHHASGSPSSGNAAVRLSGTPPGTLPESPAPVVPDRGRAPHAPIVTVARRSGQHLLVVRAPASLATWSLRPGRRVATGRASRPRHEGHWPRRPGMACSRAGIVAVCRGSTRLSIAGGVSRWHGLLAMIRSASATPNTRIQRSRTLTAISLIAATVRIMWSEALAGVTILRTCDAP